MKSLFKKSILVLLCVCLLLSAAGCAKEEASETTQEEEVSAIDALSTGSEFSPAGTAQGMSIAAENDLFQLLVDQETATVAVYVKSTGYLWTSNLDEETASKKVSNQDVMNEYMSQLLLTYYNSSYQKVIYDSYSYAVMNNNPVTPTLRFYTLENGVRIVYKIGGSIDDFFMPVVLSEERYNDLCEQIAAAGKDVESFTFAYEAMDYDDLEENSPEILSGLKLEYTKFKSGQTVYKLATDSKVRKAELYNEFLLELGVDMDYIDEAYTEVGKNYNPPDTPQFTVPVDFTLTAKGLNVNVPMDKVDYDKDIFRLNSIKVLPFFGAVDSVTNTDILIPDGSGALVDASTESEASIALRFYGDDNSLWTEEATETSEQATIPAFGITNGTNAFVAYVNDGESIGSLECHPRTKVYPFPYLGVSYVTHPFETFASNGASSQATMQVYPSDPYEGNINMDYLFLAGEDISYVEMGQAVRDYLFDSSKVVEKDTTRFYFETYGSVLRQENFLGYAYNKSTALTTFAQARIMYDKLYQNGITDIAVRYNNVFGDEYNNKLSNIGKVDSVVGDKTDMIEFQSYVHQHGSVVYPNVELVSEKYSNSLSAATWHSKFVDGTMVHYSDTNLFSEGVTAEFERLVVKSEEIIDRLPGILKKVNKLNAYGVSLSTVGDRLFSDFTDNKVKYRDAVQEDMVTIMQQVKDSDLKIMVDAGNAYALHYADDVMGVSLGCSNLSFEKTEVPFVPIVMHGKVSYSGEAMNLSDNYEMQLLKSVEYGANLAYVLNYASADMVKNTNYSQLYSTNYDHWIERAITDFKSVAGVLDGCQSSTIKDHFVAAKNLNVTVFDNGVAVAVNYNDSEVTYNGTKIPARSFARVTLIEKEG